MIKPKWYKCPYCKMKVFKKYEEGKITIMENFWELEDAKPHTCLLDETIKNKKENEGK